DLPVLRMPFKKAILVFREKTAVAHQKFSFATQKTARSPRSRLKCVCMLGQREKAVAHRKAAPCGQAR
ncbi:MAG: hypothetical protein SOT14_11190, partial [Succinivibrio sp.]|nr:hypothetical protein [Succinivibrio sp.]